MLPAVGDLSGTFFMATTGGILGASLAPVSGFDLPGKGLRSSAYASLTAMHGHTRAD